MEISIRPDAFLPFLAIACMRLNDPFDNVRFSEIISSILSVFLPLAKFVKSIYFIFTTSGIKPRFLTRFLIPIQSSVHITKATSHHDCKSKYSLHDNVKSLKCMFKRILNKNHVISLFYNAH